MSRKQIEGVHFKYEKSSASVQFTDIKSFVFGGSTARFWLSRKQMISDLAIYKKRPPFYAWECITLILASREVDLVIRDQHQMNDLLSYLILKLNTVDG
jgi:hypothetical protein